MPAPPALATLAAETSTETADQGLPDIHFVTVPLHSPPAGWPPEPQDRPEPPGADRAPGGGERAGRAGRGDPADGAQAWPRQFAVLLTEVLAGVRPVRQLQPWLSERGRVHLHRLLPLFAEGRRPTITRVLATWPDRDVLEMTLIITMGPRTRALAVRLERISPAQPPAWSENLALRAARPQSAAAGRWHCTDIEAA